jgi:hypothetical protein
LPWCLRDRVQRWMEAVDPIRIKRSLDLGLVLTVCFWVSACGLGKAKRACVPLKRIVFRDREVAGGCSVASKGDVLGSVVF